MHEKELLDYYPVKLCDENEQMIKKKKKILSGIRKILSHKSYFSILNTICRKRAAR